MPSDRYLGACRDTRKAWSHTNLLSLCRTHNIHRSRQILVEGDAIDLAEHILMLGGPVFTGLPSKAKAADAPTPADAQRAAQVAACAISALLMPVVAVRAAGAMADMALLKTLVAHWIDTGCLPEGTTGPVEEAHAIADLVSAGCAPAEAQTIRLGCVAVTAPPVETLHVIAALEPGFIDTLAAAAPAAGPAYPIPRAR